MNKLYKAKQHVETFNSYYTSGQLLYNQGRSIWANYQSKRKKDNTYRLIVDSSDRLFVPLQRWAISQLNEEDIPHTLTVRSNHDSGIDVTFSNSAKHHVEIGGHTVSVWTKEGTASALVAMMKSDLASGGLIDDEYDDDSSSSDRDAKNGLYFEMNSLEAQQAVRQFLKTFVRKEDARAREPYLYRYAERYAGWDRTNRLPNRAWESIILPGNTANRIKEDVETFVAAEDMYIHKGIPHHRGYLLYGVPGTGKTSIIKTMARHLNRNLCYLSLSSVSSDDKLVEAVGSLPENSILLIEDIDIFHDSVSREKEGAHVTLAGLLNALDGAVTPEGLITMITTNMIEKLDSALLRPGRIDVIEEFGMATNEQANKMFAWFFDRQPSIAFAIKKEVSPAQIAEVFKLNMEDAENAEQALHQLIKKE